MSSQVSSDRHSLHVAGDLAACREVARRLGASARCTAAVVDLMLEQARGDHAPGDRQGAWAEAYGARCRRTAADADRHEARLRVVARGLEQLVDALTVARELMLQAETVAAPYGLVVAAVLHPPTTGEPAVQQAWQRARDLVVDARGVEREAQRRWADLLAAQAQPLDSEPSPRFREVWAR